MCAAKIVRNREKVLDDDLSTRTFLVGERASLADVALFASFQAAKSFSSKVYNIHTYIPFQAISHILRQTFSHVTRWASTLEHLPVLSGAITSVRTGLPAGKWGRGRIRIKELLEKGTEAIGKEVVLKGWIRTMRSAEKVLACMYVCMYVCMSPRNLNLNLVKSE